MCLEEYFCSWMKPHKKNNECRENEWPDSRKAKAMQDNTYGCVVRVCFMNATIGLYESVRLHLGVTVCVDKVFVFKYLADANLKPRDGNKNKKPLLDFLYWC